MAANGVELATAYVSIIPSTAGLAPAVSRQFGAVEAAAATTGKRSGKALTGGIMGVAKSAAGPLAAVMGIAAVGQFLGDSISEAREAQKVGKLTENVIRTTGGAAKISASQVGDLAQAISNKAGVDDEAIQTGANLLLTFKNVRNEVGAGSQIFNRATQAAVDLSAAGFGSIDSASKMLGKALNDPLKGISALSRAGVTFTAQQKEQIKAMVESGNVLGAQKIIMKEVESQVGGAAAASATAGDKLRVTWGNFQEQIGTYLLPILDKLFGALSNLIGWLSANIGPAFSALGSAFGGVGSQAGVLSKIWTNVLQPAFNTVVSFIRTEVVPRVMDIWNAVKQLAAVVVPIVQQFVAGMLERLRPLMPTIRSIFGTIGQIITGALDLIKAVIERVTAVIAWIWRNWGQGIMDTIAFVWGKVLAIIRPALETIRSVITFFTKIFKGDWSGAWTAFIDIFKGIWKTIRAVIDGAVGLLGRVLKTAWDGIVSVAGTVWDKITGAIAGPVDRVMQFIQENLIDKINGLFAFLHIGLHISPIWKPNNVGTGMWKAGRGLYEKGGFTGWGGTKEPAGIVHGREWVVPAKSTLRLMREQPGLLEALSGYAGGGYVWPVNARPSFPWGRYPSGGIHRAYDLAVPSGTPVKSPYSGTVIRDGWDNTGYGYHVRIAHDAGRGYSILGHMIREVVSVGQRVAQNQIVGYSGSTGRSSGPHVHWATRWNPYSDASAFDPMKFGVAGGGGGFLGFVVDQLRNGVNNLISGAASGLGRFGWAGDILGSIIKRMGTGLVDRAAALFGLDSGGGMGGGLRVAAYDNGGLLHPGWTMAYNGLGRPETVTTGSGGDTYYFRIDARDLQGLRNLEEFVQHARRHARQLDPEGAM